MPKKGENSKAVAARQRKSEKAAAEHEKKQRAVEDELWRDEDKSLAKKQARKEEAERKRLEALAKKRERDAILLEEADKEKGGKQGLKSAPAPKVTRIQIQQRQEAAAVASPTIRTVEKEDPLPENVNRLVVEGETASTIDEALSLLKVTPSDDDFDRHPEKRMKAAYEEFEKRRIPELKAENPTLRLSQLKQLLSREWRKHPDNPLNRKLAEYNAKK